MVTIIFDNVLWDQGIDVNIADSVVISSECPMISIILNYVLYAGHHGHLLLTWSKFNTSMHK